MKQISIEVEGEPEQENETPEKSVGTQYYSFINDAQTVEKT